VIVVVVVFVLFLAWQGLGEGEFGAQGGPQMTGAELQALTIGGSRDEIERAVGKGDSALEYDFFGGTGTAVEPMDATCVYYGYAGKQDVASVVQLCYRDNELASKNTFRSGPE
jgi:hypothetical protein